jgi:hypothetical protein
MFPTADLRCNEQRQTGELLRSMSTVATAVKVMMKCYRRSFVCDFNHHSLFVSYTCMHIIYFLKFSLQFFI